MRDVLRRLLADFLSTIVFLAVMWLTGDVVVATAVALAGAVVQVGVSRWQGRPLSPMTWASLALVVVLGAATLLTHDARFVLMKPSIAHFAIGAIMLKPGWMNRYMPPVILDNAPDLPVVAGYAWAALMFVLGAGTIGFALAGDLPLWTLYVTLVAPGAKIAAFAVQFAVFRLIVARRLRRAAATS